MLVVSRDRRFLDFAGFVLARNGFSVERSERFSDAPALVDRYVPDVVLVDASDSVSSATRLVAAVQGANPDSRVVVVCEDGDRYEGAQLDFVAKWSPEALLAGLVAHDGSQAGNGGVS